MLRLKSFSGLNLVFIVQWQCDQNRLTPYFGIYNLRPLSLTHRDLRVVFKNFIHVFADVL